MFGKAIFLSTFSSMDLSRGCGGNYTVLFLQRDRRGWHYLRKTRDVYFLRDIAGSQKCPFILKQAAMREVGQYKSQAFGNRKRFLAKWND